MPKPSRAMIVQIVRVAGSRSMRAEIVPALKPAGPLTFMFPRPMSPAPPRAFTPQRALLAACQIRTAGAVSSLFQHCAVDAPRPPAGRDEIEEDEAEQDRQFSAIGKRINRAGRVGHEIGEGHFAGENEGHDPRVGADQQQEAADRFEDGRENEEAAQRGAGNRKAEHLRQPVLKKQQRNDNAQNAEDIGPQPLDPGVKPVHWRLSFSPGRVPRIRQGAIRLLRGGRPSQAFGLSRDGPAHSRACFRAAAAAKGAAAIAARDSAHSVRNGGRNGAAPPLAEEAAATPKMSAGIVSGNTRTAIRRPPRRSETVSAAPIAPIMVSAGVPAASVAATSASGPGAIASMSPNRGLKTTSGSALAVQCAAHFTRTTTSGGAVPLIRRSSEPSS